ncbi:hypothetical protein CIPAW_04G119400 [Carya illinoinensis]|uniref:Uncharacterized protein n=1 Tax=Carya illinoinensis TaxID=32201 RepID=A0A8T1QTW6_CARIL|nr:hypothetical protein CIPAW_04G119400 [Carya illinoinensis]KAG6657853.1 hypothetical protein CIPAW_04G119400 [Carya illinoinensis]KAG6657855.1 hypothetical protein CIPAW_04G119400 [Carya illinoinensis]
MLYKLLARTRVFRIYTRGMEQRTLGNNLDDWIGLEIIFSCSKWQNFIFSES